MSDPAEEEAAVLTAPPVAAPHTLRYGDHPEQLYDLWPASAAGPEEAPTVVLLHGGFWKQAYDRRYLSPLAAHLSAHGFTAALPEYRRVGGDGGWPGTLDDVAAVVDRLSADRPPLLLGHSAGGHLALWAAARGLLPATAPWHGGRPPLGVLAVAPVADLAGAVRDGLGGGAATALLGGADQVASRLPYADPSALGRTGVPTVLLHGEDDPDVPVAQSRTYAAAVPGTRLLALPGTGHFAPVHPGTEACAVLLAALRDLAGSARAGAAHPAHTLPRTPRSSS